MQTKKAFSLELFAIFAFFSLVALSIAAQTFPVQSRITASVDETKLTMLSGNTHPLARPQFDRGLAPTGLAMEHMLLVLKQSPDQQATLDKLLAEQQDKSSPNYHKWLSPDQFGQQFGASDQDIQKITSWLQSHGFQVNNIVHGRNIVDFSGTASQVQLAFHTEIHRYVFNNGEEHWANATDPAIPTAFAPVIAGIDSLHNFPRKPAHHNLGVFQRDKTTGKLSSAQPDFTFSSNSCNGNCFGIGPFDFATIYNVLPLWNAGIDGTGEIIAIPADSNINILDPQNFRAAFGLAANNPQVVVNPNSSDPGIVPDSQNGEEGEADVDVEWSGAVARNATIKLVVSKDTASTSGIDLSSSYIVNTLNPPIMSLSFNNCELDLGTGGNQTINTLWQQAASQGITVLVATGDSGSAGCDFFDQSSGTPQAALGGVAANGLASTPFDLAVGGTDFNQLSNPTQFWNTTNNGTTSAKGYIPETTWNDSCTNAFFGSNAEVACNLAQNSDLVLTIGGSGGISNCTTSNGISPSTCSGGYAKPTWQTGTGVPSDGKRDLPDVSLFAGDGFTNSFYIFCQQDSTHNLPCSLGTSPEFLGVGGTSVSTQAFAGIVALIDQKNESREGNLNPVMYGLAAVAGNTCASTANPSASCIFNDVTVGTITQPCQAKATPGQPASPNCLITVPSDTFGILVDSNNLPAYNAGTGYDLATGLGSVNASNLVNAPTVWNTATSTRGVDFTLSFTGPSNITIPKGSQGTVGLTVTAENGFTGVVTLSCTTATLPSEVTCSNPTINGSGSNSIAIMTTASSALPAWKLNTPAKWTLGEITLLAFLLCTAAIFAVFSGRQRRWSTAFALIAFAGIIGCAGCSGGGSSSGGGGGGGGGGTTNPGTPTGTSVVVITATSGTIQRSVAVTLTVD